MSAVLEKLRALIFGIHLPQHLCMTSLGSTTNDNYQKNILIEYELVFPGNCGKAQIYNPKRLAI